MPGVCQVHPMQPFRMSALVMERRQAPRQVIDRPGKLLFGGREISCTIGDLGGGGAGLLVESFNIAELPAEFLLVVDNESHPRSCRIAWTDGNRLGVKFK
jgi:PilZ domain